MTAPRLKTLLAVVLLWLVAGPAAAAVTVT